MASIVMLGMAAMLGAQGTPPQADALAPSGKWIAEFEDSMCVLSRRFGTGPGEATLAFRSTPGNQALTLYLIRPTSRRVEREGNAELVIEPSGTHAATHFTEGTSRDGTQRFAEMSILRSDLPDLATAKAISLRLGSDTPVRVRPDVIAAALKTQALCEDAVVKDWGYDPVVLRTLSKQPVPATSPQTWITNDDYPEEALRQHWSGTASLYLAVGPDGKVQRCAITQSSGQAVLDSAACATLSRRARFEPALDKDGEPVAAPWASRFTWHLPGG